MVPEWFRKESWTPTEQAEFFARLQRARPRNRAQYLRIQAVHLAGAGEGDGALQLLELLLNDYPEELEIAAAQHLRARCLEAMGRLDGAGEAFRASLSAMRRFPNVRTDSHLDFALFVIRHAIESEYREALNALDEFSDKMIFPLQVYKHAAARALLLARVGGDPNEVGALARRALEESRRSSSDLPYHPNLGLVRDADRAFEGELKELAKD